MNHPSGWQVFDNKQDSLFRQSRRIRITPTWNLRGLRCPHALCFSPCRAVRGRRAQKRRPLKCGARSRLAPNTRHPRRSREHYCEAGLDGSGLSTGMIALDLPPESMLLFRYAMHTLPSELDETIGTSTIRRVERGDLRRPGRGRAPRSGARQPQVSRRDARRAAQARRALVLGRVRFHYRGGE